ncbi:unnamed protein product [Strongylus vulgaris]|uniref:Secreted protein n=1 Tax=Strongylus vulgaris TaxID=40348 RepID=A0A3P7JXN2_STRVU|nr:unnamed protein product [Strongylus vulgaris]
MFNALELQGFYLWTISLLIFSPPVSDGRVRMCPPGGSSFTMAWSMACTMRRKRDVMQEKRICKTHR